MDSGLLHLVSQINGLHTHTHTVVFLSCPLVKKHADLSGSFLYSQSTMKDMYSKPTNRTELSIPMKTKALRSHYIYTNRRTFGKRNNQNVPEQLNLESSFTFTIYSDYACLKGEQGNIENYR